MQEKILKQLVKFKTLSLDQKTNLLALKWIVNGLKHLPLKFKFINHKGFNSLIIFTKRQKTPKLALAGHLDVVDGSAKIFRPKVIGSKLFGRGVFDMKYAIACYIAMLLELGKKLSGLDLALLITTDEELGGKNGSKAVIKNGFKPKFCFLPDGGKDWVLQESAKGAMQVLITAKGVSGHGSRPWTGINAIDELYKFIQHLKKELADKNQNKKTVRGITLNLGSLNGGNDANKIPDSAQAKIDIRFNFPETPKSINSKIKTICKKYPKVGYKILTAGEAYKVDKKHPVYKNFVSLVEAALGKKASFLSSPGSSDARYFLNNNIPTALIRPIGGGHHTEKEFIDLNSLRLFYKLLCEFVRTEAKNP